MDIIASVPPETNSLSPNSACPCGSTNAFGPIKYKRCCGKGKKFRRRTPTTPVIDFLRECTYAYAFGENKILTTTKESFVFNYNRKRKRKISNSDFQDHFDGVYKLYFYANSHWMTRKLCMIDIDVQKSKKMGSQSGALAFARHVDELFQKWHFAGSKDKIYWEPSSSGVGLAGYIIITGANNDQVRAAYDHLQQLLKTESGSFDIEGVEIKGKPCSIEYGPRNIVGELQIKDVTFGTLAKYPTSAKIVDLKSMPEIHFDEIFGIALPIKTPAPTGKTTTKHSPPSHAGSYQPLSQDYLDLLPAFRRQAEELFTRQTWEVDGCRAVVTTEDIAVNNLLTYYMTQTETDGNKKKPTKRFETLWKCLLESGYTDRDYHDGRHAAIRNAMSDMGFVTWHNNEYWKKFGDNAPGKALEYSINQDFKDHLELCRLVVKAFEEMDSSSQHTHTFISSLTGFRYPVNAPIIRPVKIENPHVKLPMLVLHSNIEPLIFVWTPMRRAA